MKKLIDKDRLLTEMREELDTFCISDLESLAASLIGEKFYKFINDYPTVEDADVQPFNQWISVDDKLPEWDKTVLVWYTSDTLFGVSEGYGLSWYHRGWRVNGLNGENIRIFYWQYLPEKPKDGDTE